MKASLIQVRKININMSKLTSRAPPSEFAHLVYICKISRDVSRLVLVKDNINISSIRKNYLNLAWPLDCDYINILTSNF